jgi:hypothetical protein
MVFLRDGRQLFVHPAHGQIGISPFAGRLADASVPWQAARVALVVGSDNQRWPSAAASLLEQLHGDGRLVIEHFPCEPGAAIGGSLVSGSAGPLGQSPAWDCLVLLGRPGPALARRLRLETYCRQGGALVALGSASQALPDWPAFAEVVLGGWDEGPGCNPVPLEVESAGEIWYHPLLEGVGPFATCADPRGPVWLARGAEILLWGFGGGLRKPLAWAWHPRGGRVFYSLLGRRDDFQQPSFLRLLANAVRWAAALGPL